jgi:hypothetical protein
MQACDLQNIIVYRSELFLAYVQVSGHSDLIEHRIIFHIT